VITTSSMQETVKETDEGTALVRETGTSFERIYNVVETQAQEIDTISQMVRILLQSASSVVQITQDVSIATQQSSASTRDVSRNMEVLAERAEQLLGSVEAFKLRDDAGAAPSPMAFGGPMQRVGN
jgi:methyl-accepting chemotaxis protein